MQRFGTLRGFEGSGIGGSEANLGLGVHGSGFEEAQRAFLGAVFGDNWRCPKACATTVKSADIVTNIIPVNVVVQVIV